MQNGQSYYGIFAGLGGFMGVALGAVAAHHAADPHAAELLRLASLYAVLHSLALLYLCQREGKCVCLACFLFALGILLFCGGMASKALSGALLFPWLIPFGGTCLMAGWLAVAGSFVRKKDALRWLRIISIGFGIFAYTVPWIFLYFWLQYFFSFNPMCGNPAIAATILACIVSAIASFIATLLAIIRYFRLPSPFKWKNLFEIVILALPFNVAGVFAVVFIFNPNNSIVNHIMNWIF